MYQPFLAENGGPMIMIQALDRVFACTVNLIRNQNIQNLKHLITGGTGQNLSLGKWQYARAGPSERSRGSPRGLTNRSDRAGAPRVDPIPSRRSAHEGPSSGPTVPSLVELY